MRAIKLVQYGSTIALLLVVLYIMVMGCLILVGAIRGTILELGQQVAMFVIFIGPEKLVAFFGPVLKRKQEKENG